MSARIDAWQAMSHTTPVDLECRFVPHYLKGIPGGFLDD
jgi:hypothetical protein